MDDNTDTWRQYYDKVLTRKHTPRAEFAAGANQSGVNIVIDCGCGTGSEIAYFTRLGYQAYGFDINSDSVAICRDRFGHNPLVEISQASFERYDYPKCGVVIANSSLFFADPLQFEATWSCIVESLAQGGVFAGNFMGNHDSWAADYHSDITAMTRQQVKALFKDFNIVEFHERDEPGKTVIGVEKHWHTFSVVAIKAHDKDTSE